MGEGSKLNQRINLLIGQHLNKLLGDGRAVWWSWLCDVGHLECGTERYVLSTLSCYCSPPATTTMAFFLMYWDYARINLSTFEFFPSVVCKSYVKLTDTSWKNIAGPIVARLVLQSRRSTLCLLSFTTKQTTAFEDHCFCSTSLPQS